MLKAYVLERGFKLADALLKDDHGCWVWGHVGTTDHGHWFAVDRRVGFVWDLGERVGWDLAGGVVRTLGWIWWLTWTWFIFVSERELLLDQLPPLIIRATSTLAFLVGYWFLVIFLRRLYVNYLALFLLALLLAYTQHRNDWELGLFILLKSSLVVFLDAFGQFTKVLLVVFLRNGY